LADEPEIKTTDEARSGESRGRVWRILLISVVLAVVVIAGLALGTP
jgi:hypothetical protein